jgi:hypothetical protein
MSAYRAQVAQAIEAVEILGPLRYAWRGRRSRLPPAALLDLLDAAACRRHLLAGLREELYWSFYCRGGTVPARWGESAPPPAGGRLLRDLAAANTGHGGWEPGWTVERVDGEEAVVVSSRLRVRAPRAACRSDSGELLPGTAVSLALPAERPALSPGFVTLVGDSGEESSTGVVRVYWHVTHRGAAPLVGALTSKLNAAAVPFRLKLLDHPARFDRCDAAVLYLDAADFTALRHWCVALAAELSGSLRPAVPALTLALAPGVAAAEDDGTGESFGVVRCTLVAEGLLDAHERDEDPFSAVAARFAGAGVDLDAPYRARAHVL